MSYVFWWLLLAIPCFFAAYCNGADMNFRLEPSKCDDGLLKMYKKFFAQGLRLFVHDYFGVYCPWSWERAKRYRLADMRVYLGANGLCHVSLGHITAMDCDNPTKQEEIARCTFISRTAHWYRGVIYFIVAPIPGSLIIIAILIGGVVELGRHIAGKNT